MLCCLPSSWVDAKAAYEQQASSNEGISAYPGQRRGTVLSAISSGNSSSYPANTSSSYLSSPTQPSYDSTKTSSTTTGQLVSVTVPAGVTGGQIVHVAHPDGSGSLIRAEVPKGLKPGNIFYVKAPAVSSPPPSAPISPAVAATPIPPPATKPSNPPSPQQQSPMAEAYPIYGEHIDVTGLSSPASSSPPPFSQCLDDGFAPSRYTPAHAAPWPSPLPVGYNNNNPGQTSSPSGMTMVKVVVPPGSVPGSTIHVQIPGEENRLVAAQIPHNCTEFYVQYNPQEEPPSPAPSSTILNSPAMYAHYSYQPRVAVPSTPATTVSDYAPSSPGCFPNTKLLSVHVPKGTPAGSMLHVQVPDEPGRLLSARVPPGDVKEFHISYLPRSSREQPIATSATRPRGDWGSAALPVVSGVAASLAGAMVFDHFAHHNNR